MNFATIFWHHVEDATRKGGWYHHRPHPHVNAAARRTINSFLERGLVERRVVVDEGPDIDWEWEYRLTALGLDETTEAKLTANRRSVTVASEALDRRAAFTADETGSARRFEERSTLWAGVKLGGVRHAFWWVIHNAVAHPAIAVAPFGPLFDFHDWTSRRLHANSTRTPEGM